MCDRFIDSSQRYSWPWHNLPRLATTVMQSFTSCCNRSLIWHNLLCNIKRHSKVRTSLQSVALNCVHVFLAVWPRPRRVDLPQSIWQTCAHSFDLLTAKLISPDWQFSMLFKAEINKAQVFTSVCHWGKKTRLSFTPHNKYHIITLWCKNCQKKKIRPTFSRLQQKDQHTHVPKWTPSQATKWKYWCEETFTK